MAKSKKRREDPEALREHEAPSHKDRRDIKDKLDWFITHQDYEDIDVGIDYDGTFETYQPIKRKREK